MPFVPKSTYYDKHYRQSASLIRARQPYLVKNLIMGAGIITFVLSVYSYTIKVVSQDDFSDIPIPDEPPQPPRTPNVGVEKAASSAEVDSRKDAAKKRFYFF